MSRPLLPVMASFLVVASAPAQAQYPPPPTAPPPTAAPPGPPTAQPPGPPTPPANLPTAGGLTAPGPIDPDAKKPASETDKKLEDAKEDDSGRGLTWFWLELEGGFQHVGLETFKVDESNLTAGFVSTESSGGFVGAGLGAQLLWFRIGPRGRIGFYKDWQMFSIGGELGLRIPLGPLEPYLNLGAGYTALGSVSDTLNAVPDSIQISGFDVRVGGGLDFFIGNVFFLGASASWEFLGLTRPGVSLSDINASSATNLDEAQKAALAAEGSGYGSAISIGGKLGLAF